MLKRIVCFALCAFVLLLINSSLFAERNPSDFFLTSNVQDNPFFEEASRNKANKASLEKIKIQYLIEAVRRSSAIFIRNGTEHTGKEAAAHLSRKYSYAGEKSQSAQDFIEGIASKSMFTGSPYLVKSAEGCTTPLRSVLRKELQRLDGCIKQ